MDSELVFNIWFIVDIGTELSNHAIIKPYSINGNDDDKLKILQYLAETDYVTSERIDYAENCVIEYHNMKIEGHIHQSLINNYFDLNINFFLNIAEEKLPQLYKFSGGDINENQTIFQKFPNNPFFVQTILMENEYGEIRPYTTKENKAWAESEKIRINNKSLGMQN
jgi:hypothetical protein